MIGASATSASPSEADGRLPGGGGCFVAVAGPSGAGKDSLLRALGDRLRGDARIIIARRVVTRESDGNEDHDTVSESTFDRLRMDGAFLLHWSANGLGYGLPGSLARELALGRSVIANVSRTVLADVRRRFHPNAIIHVTASPEILAARLAARGREADADRTARLARGLSQPLPVAPDLTIDNSGDLSDAVQLLERSLDRLIFRIPLGL